MISLVAKVEFLCKRQKTPSRPRGREDVFSLGCSVKASGTEDQVLQPGRWLPRRFLRSSPQEFRGIRILFSYRPSSHICIGFSSARRNRTATFKPQPPITTARVVFQEADCFSVSVLPLPLPGLQPPDGVPALPRRHPVRKPPPGCSSPKQ